MGEEVEKREIAVKDYLNVLVLKNHLIMLNEEQLSKVYHDDINYVIFIKSLHKLTLIDSGFLYLDDGLIEKIEMVIDYNRFKTDSDIRDTINEIIKFLNSVKYSSPELKNLYQLAYLAYQEETRKVKINDIDELLDYLAYDARIVEVVMDGNTGIMDDDTKFMASLNYLVKMAPEALQEPYIHSCIDDCLASIKVAPFSFKTRKLLKDTKDNYQRIKRKEE